MGHSRPLVSLFSSFQQLTRIHVHYEILADDWIQIADLLYQKQLLCQLSHNHCTNFAFFIESISVLFRLSLVLVNQQMYTYLSYHYPSPGFEVRASVPTHNHNLYQWSRHNIISFLLTSKSVIRVFEPKTPVARFDRTSYHFANNAAWLMNLTMCFSIC